MSLDRLNEILKSERIPFSTKKMIENLSLSGKKALNSYYDESSSFYRNAKPVNLARKFLAAPEEYPDLFHYTSSASLKAILKSKDFLIGSIDGMNDTEEIRHVLNICYKQLSLMNATNKEKEEFKSYFISMMKTFDTYVWSFTPNGNSMAMERYGDVAIGFRNQDIQNKLAEHFTPINFANGFMREGDAYVFPLKVNYDVDYQSNYLLPIVKVVLAAIQNIDIDSFDMNQLLKDGMIAIYMLSLCFKRPEIREENEIRFLILRLMMDGKTQEDLVYHHRRMVKISVDDSLIRRIIIDHKWDGREQSMIDMVRNLGFSRTKIQKTLIPY